MGNSFFDSIAKQQQAGSAKLAQAKRAKPKPKAPSEFQKIVEQAFAPVGDPQEDQVKKAQAATGPSTFRKVVTPTDKRSAAQTRKEQAPGSFEASFSRARRELPKKMTPEDEQDFKSAVWILSEKGDVDPKALKELTTRFRKDKAGVKREVSEFRAARAAGDSAEAGQTGAAAVGTDDYLTDGKFTVDDLQNDIAQIFAPVMDTVGSIGAAGAIAKVIGPENITKAGESAIDALQNFDMGSLPQIGQFNTGGFMNPEPGQSGTEQAVKMAASLPLELAADFGRMNDPNLDPRRRTEAAIAFTANVATMDFAALRAVPGISKILGAMSQQRKALQAAGLIADDVAGKVDDVARKLDEFVPQEAAGYDPGVVPDLRQGLDEVPPVQPQRVKNFNELTPDQQVRVERQMRGEAGEGDTFHLIDFGNGARGAGEKFTIVSRGTMPAAKGKTGAPAFRLRSESGIEELVPADALTKPGGNWVQAADDWNFTDTPTIPPVKQVEPPVSRVEDIKGNTSAGGTSQEPSEGQATVSPSADVPKAGTDAVPTPKAEAVKPEDVPPPKPAKAESAVPDEPVKSTGLANQVQAKEAADGALDEVLSSTGKSAKEWQKVGEDILNQAERPDYEDLAYRVGKGDEELTGEKVGILLAGKRRMLANLNDLAAKLKTDPTNGKLRREYEAAREAIRDYEQNIQAGKGRWSDVGRSLQGGADVDTGDFAAVIAEAERFGKTVDPKTAAKLEAETAKVAELQKKLDELEAMAPEARAQELVKAARTSPRANKVQIQNNIARNREALKKAWAKSGVKGGKRGGAAGINPDIAPIIRELATDYVKLGVANLDDVVKKIQQVFKEETGESISRQDVIDNMSAEGPTRTRSEIQKEIDRIRRESKAQSTGTKAEQAAKAKVSAARQKARLAEREAARLERQALKNVEDAEKATEKLSVKRAKEKARQAKLEADTLAKQAEKEFGDMWRYQDRVLKMEDEIDRLRGELDEGRFLVTPKRKAPVDKQLEDLKAEKDIYDARVRKMIDNHNLSRPAKIIKGTVGLVRGTQLGADLGMLTRQGLFAWARPVEAARAVGSATKAMFSEVQAMKYTRAINERRVNGSLAAVARKKAGLQLSDMYNDPEEISFTQLIKAIPGLRNFGGGLERFQHVFINQIRTDTFDRALKLGYSPDELKARARFINAATGRGAKVPGAIGDALDVIMTSPRYEASRWQLLADPAISGVQALKGNRGARDNVKQMATTAAEIIGLMQVAQLAGYEIQYDPSHTDFGKLRKGDKTWDVTAGIAPRLRDMVRMGLTVFGPDYGEDVVTTGGKMISRTISPVKQLYSQGSIAYQRSIGNPNPKDPLSGFKSEEEREGLIAFAPLIAQSMKETWGLEGPVAAATEGIKEFLGGSTGRYPKNTKPTMLEKSVQKVQGTYKYPKPKAKKGSQFPPPAP